MPGHGGRPFISRKKFLKSLCDFEGDVIAYSMGARLALEALYYYNAPFSSLTCLSTTLEVTDDIVQTQKEKEWIKSLEKNSLENFINNWYQAPIFKGFSPPAERFLQSKDALIQVLKEYSISKCPPLLPKIHKKKKKVQFIYRKNDPKAECLKSHPHVHFVPSRSHCIHLETPKECKILIDKFTAL